VPQSTEPPALCLCIFMLQSQTTTRPTHATEFHISTYTMEN